MYSPLKTVALASFLIIGSVATMAQDALAQAMPDGASAITEVFGDWVVGCDVVEGTSHCVLSQKQTLEDGRRLVLVNLFPQPSGDFEAVMVLPFGLLLAEGLVARVDQQPWGSGTLQFHSCQPVGCLVELSFGLAEAQMLRAGAVLQLTGVTDEREPYGFQISLAGLTAAMDRTLVLRQ